MPEQYKFFIDLADELKLLGHPDRLRIIFMCSNTSSVTVGEMAEVLTMKPQTITQLVSKLKLSGVLVKIKHGAYALVEGNATVDAIVKLMDEGVK